MIHVTQERRAALLIVWRNLPAAIVPPVPIDEIEKDDARVRRNGIRRMVSGCGQEMPTAVRVRARKEEEMLHPVVLPTPHAIHHLVLLSP
jgi:hypothetical protein